MAVLVFIKSRKLFLKVQEGIGDNLTREDLAAGFVDYALWSTFRPEDLDLDQELTMEVVDGGMVSFKAPTSAREAVAACYEDALGDEWNADDVLELADDSAIADGGAGDTGGGGGAG